MNKSQFIDAIALEAGMSKVQAKKSVEAFITVVENSLKNGEKIAITGFGSFTTNEKPARTGRNPKTGEAINIEAKKSVKFKAGAELNAAIE